MCGKDRAASRADTKAMASASKIVLREVKRPLNSNKGNKQSLSEKIQKLKPKFTPLNDPSVKTNKSPGTNNCLQTTSPDNPKQSKKTLPLSSASGTKGIQGSKSPSKAEPRDELIFVRRGPSLRYGSSHDRGSEVRRLAAMRRVIWFKRMDSGRVEN